MISLTHLQESLISLLLGFLPFGAFAGLVAMMRKRHPNADWRFCIIEAALLWGAILLVITESLSLPGWISRTSIALSWLLVIVVTQMNLRRTGMPRNVVVSPTGDRWTLAEKGLLAAMLCLAAAVGITAFISPPNNWDSMTYHMSRIMHWIRRGSIDAYPTHISRQVYQYPWSEFALMHFQLLIGSDRLANLLQWFGYLGLGIAASLLAAHLKGSRFVQLLAAFITMTLPAVILEGSSTQNDVLASFWLLAAVLLIFQSTEHPQPIALGVALGLAIITKQTNYIIAAPFILWWIWRMLRKNPVRRAFALILTTASCALLLNAPLMARSWMLSGSPLGIQQEPSAKYHFNFSNDRITVKIIASNAIRNAALHWGTPWNRVNWGLYALVRGFHRRMGQDLNDPASTWPGTNFFIDQPSRDEDEASNTLHWLVFTLAGLALLSNLRWWRDADNSMVVVLGTTAGFLLFCATVVWQPWHSRLHIGFFALMAPVVALQMGRRHVFPAVAVAAVLFATSLPYAFENENRPLIGAESVLTSDRVNVLFRKRPGLQNPYVHITREMESRGIKDVGLILQADDWEYPLWAMSDHTRRFRHVRVDNFTRRCADQNWTSSAIICTSCGKAEHVEYDGHPYRLVMNEPPLQLFVWEN